MQSAATREWDFDRQGVHAGHYFMENYAAAKKDFAVRAGLVESQRLFSDEQIAVIKNACEFALEDDATLSYAEEKQLRSVQERIELLLPQQERNQHPTIESIRAPGCPALLRMTNTMANVDELDWLGKQLESFDRYELLQFNAAVERFGLSAADELIDLSFCAREVTVISDFTDLEKAGKRHYLTVHGACDPKELEDLDGKETALALISGQPGYVTRYGVVYDNGIKLEQAYDRRHLPPIWMAANSILELKIRATGEDDPKKQEWVQLPASRMKLERVMLRVGIVSCGEMQMLVSDSRFPDEVNCALDFERESLFELNRLCHACSNFKEQDLEKLGAVCQMAKPACAANIRQLAENLDQFDFAPNVHTPEELGKYMIQQSGHYEYDENLEDFYNYGDYGVKRMLQEDGVFVDRGYVSYHGTLTLDEMMRDDPAERYQQEQETHMNEMTL